MPECMASSTPYWIRGLSTSASISLGCALVAGRNRVPSPAAGNTAFRTFDSIVLILATFRLGPPRGGLDRTAQLRLDLLWKSVRTTEPGSAGFHDFLMVGWPSRPCADF